MTTPQAIAAPRDRQAPSANRDYLSLTAIRTYQSCPLRYFFKYVAGLPERTISASLAFGTAIHRALEHHYRELALGGAAPGLPSLVTAYQAEWTQRPDVQIQFSLGDDRASLDRLAERMLTAFVASSAAVPEGRILAVEEQLRGGVIAGLPDLLGRVDLMVGTPRELLVVDWKTSRSKWSAAQVEEASEQLLLYAELARDVTGGKQVRLEFTVLTKTKEVAIERHRFPVDPARLARTKRTIERVWRAMEGEHFYPAPSLIGCSGCPFRQPCQQWAG
jgi:CRISPR/Cas system-associated exonuclease Cas4 (RecB family)